MRLAVRARIDVPFHGMVRSKDGSLTYFIRRFDRVGRKDRVPVEDFAQLTGRSRDTKYDSSMEKVSKVLDTCTFPALERGKLFRRTIFSFLVGNTADSQGHAPAELKAVGLDIRNKAPEIYGLAIKFWAYFITFGQASPR